jgi:hypothetical protein
MTRRETDIRITSDAPRAVTALTPDPDRFTPAYWLGRAVGRLVSQVAGIPQKTTHRIER